MEDSLDIIANGEKIWHTLCKECYDEICDLSKDIQMRDKESIKIDKDHTYIIGKYGPIIKCTNNGKTTFKKVRDDVDIDKLRNKEYAIGEVICEGTACNNDVLGKYKNEDVIVKTGKYGKYINWSNTNVSASKVKDEIITLELAIGIIVEKEKELGGKTLSILRTIDESTTIRRGKYGDYIFYKKPQWKTPRFIKLAGFIKKNGKNSYLSCDIESIKSWLREEHKIA